jgi:PAS domain S-box-containing protein
MDIHLAGEMDGVAAAAEIRHRFHLPVIFLTAYGDEDTLRRAKTSVPMAYLHKPCQDRDLRAMIEVSLALASAERQLRRAEQRLSATLRSVADGIAVTDDRGRVTRLNPMAAELTGWSETEAMGHPVDDVVRIVGAKTGAVLDSHVGRALETLKPIELERGCALVARDGARRSIEGAVTLLDLEAGRAEGAVLVFRDVSARLEAEVRERELQTLQALNLVAGGTAHHINNALTPIVGYLELAHEALPPGSEVRDMLRRMEKPVERAKSLAQRLSHYCGSPPMEAQPVDLSALVRDIATALGANLPPPARIEFALAERCPAVLADPARLRLVMHNLVANSAEALAGGAGVITVRTGARHVGREALAGAVPGRELPAGTYAFLEVADTGPGVSADVRARIFDPFFSTKLTGRGLGLAEVHGIVRQHSGAILLDSAPGSGTTLTVLLPVIA